MLFKEKEKERENESQSDAVGVGAGGIRAGASVVSPRDAGERYDKLGRKKKKKDPSKAKQIRPLKIEIVCGACEFIEAKGIFLISHHPKSKIYHINLLSWTGLSLPGILRKRGDEDVSRRLRSKFYRDGI